MQILFICEYNACRSQMGEGIARAYLPKNIGIHSAGLHPGILNEHTVEVMKEVGIDISGQKSKLLFEVSHIQFDHIFILAEPVLAHVGILKFQEAHHWIFEDPVAIPGDTDWLKEKVRRVRDVLQEKISHFFRK